MNKPKNLGTAHLEYLDDLRESGQINMFGAAQYLADEFPSLEIGEARGILAYWTQTYSDRQTEGG